MTSRELLRAAARELRAAGVPDPEYDAGMLLAKVTGEPALKLRAGFTEITPEQASAFHALTERRKQREPLQYLLGDTVFLGEVFTVRPGVLIPRPETEMLAERAIRWLRKRRFPTPNPEVLDLCCGSGCLGISVKRQMPAVRCTMTDLSPEALALTEENVRRMGVECETLAGDLFEPVQGRRFDLILSNPPYIPAAECDGLQAEVMREPRMALDGGADGLDFYRRIAKKAPAHLKPGGCLMLEIGYGEREAVEKLLTENGAISVRTEADFSGIPRMVFAEYQPEPAAGSTAQRKQCGPGRTP